jgi:uncharacterized protein YjbI with pentapeptide repeats
MENVIFKGGIMSNSSRDERVYRDDWNDVKVVNKVVFDGVSMRDASLSAFYDGTLIFKNMSDFRNYDSSGTILRGSRNINLRIDNCQLDGKGVDGKDGIQLCAIGEPAHRDGTIYATNSKFTNGSGFAGSQTKTTYIDNCEFTGSAEVGYPQVMVIKNSILGIGVVSTNFHWGDIYFVNNKYLTCFRPGDTYQYRSAVNSKNVYFINDGTAMKSADGSNHVQPIAVNVCGGGANIYDIDLQGPTFMGDIEYLNLRNVRILGGEWYNLNLKGGHWENVEIHAPIEIAGAPPQFGDDLKFYSVTTPQGSPFNTPVQFTVTESRQPFAWPEVHVPTLEEMGID